MNHRFRRLLLLLVLPFLTTACFDIEEELSLKRNGSGEYRITLDMTRAAEMMKGFMTAEQLAESDMFDSMDSSIQAQAANLRSVEGISNVRHQSDGYRYTLAYDFASVEALNTASASGLGMGEMEPISSSGTSYALSGKTFERIAADVSGMFDNMDEEQQEAMQMARMMMADANYKIIYHMPGKVRKMTNESATLTDGKKTVVLDAGFLDILDGKVLMGNKVVFK
ncbi:MAG: hypothetical protein OHK0039_23160 [Bacteroidia bacterium]